MIKRKSKKVTRPILLCVMISVLSVPLHATEIRILFSSSLNGNLDGCSCKLTPVSGLVKRGAFIKKYRRRHPQVILVDTGDLIADHNNKRLTRAVYAAYRLLKYDAVLPGDQDLAAGVPFFRQAFKGIPAIASNLWLKNGPTKIRAGYPFLNELLIRRRGRLITIIGLAHKNAFKYMPVSIRKSIHLTSKIKAVRRAKKSDLLIILSHGGIDADKLLAKKIKRPAIFIGGHDQTLFKPRPGIYLKKGLWYFQSGRDGNALGEIVLTISGGGSYKIKSQRLITFDYNRDPDHPQIRRMIKKLRRR